MFKNKDIICFLGDSLTADGLWMAEVYQTLRKKYAIKCYNCGVSGGTCEKALFYLQNRCLIHNPDYVVVMFGINDIRREFYKDEYSGVEEYEKIKREAIEVHKVSYEKIIREITASGAKVILCVPPPYDDVNDKNEYKLDCRKAMETIGEFATQLSEKYGCPLVDFGSVMDSMLSQRDIIGADRVHPTEEGYHIMAQIFLKSIGEIDAADFDVPFEWEEWNKERYDAERELHKVNFIEYCILLKEGYAKKMTYEERKKIAKERYEGYEDKSAFIPMAYDEYIKKIDNYGIYLAEIVKKTIF